MSNLRKQPSAPPVWRPAPTLKSVDPKNVRFIQDPDARGGAAKFASWTVEPLETPGMLSAKQAAAHKAADQHSEHDGLQGNQSAAELPEGASALTSLDPAFLESIKQEAYARGLADGQQMKMAALQDEAAQAQAQQQADAAEKTLSLLTQIEQAVVAMQEDPHLRHEPLKRLALHLAEQLTLVELSLSPASVQTLIERCLETLDVSPSGAVVVELNPSDMAVLQSRTHEPGEEKHNWRLQADAQLLPGSVRVRADDAVVSDLVENRLESLAQSLLLEPSRWQPQSTFQPDRLNSRRGQAHSVEDALPRPASFKEEEPSIEPLNLADLDLPDLDLTQPDDAHD